MLWWAWILMAVATAVVVYMAVAWARDDVEGFEDDALRTAVVDEFVKQKGDKPTPEQFSAVLDTILQNDMTADDVPEQVRLAIQAVEEADPVVTDVVKEFVAQSGEKPTMDELNAVVDAVKAGEVTDIADYVSKILAEEVPVGKVPRNVVRLVVDSFRIHKGSKPSVQELSMVLDAIENGEIEVAKVGDFVKEVVAKEIDEPDEPEVPYADKPDDFDINEAIVKAFLEHAGRRPNLEELKNVRAAISSPDEALKFVQDTVVKADIVVANVRAASDMTDEPVTDDEIDKIVEDVRAGRKSLREVIAHFSGIASDNPDAPKLDEMEALDDAEFVEKVYAHATGEEPDPDTSVFLLAKLRSWDGDREKLVNLVATMAIAVVDSDEKHELIRELIVGLTEGDVGSAARDYNLSLATRRPVVGESPVPRMTSMDRAFNMNIGDTDRILLAATRRSRGPSHDLIREGDDMVLRDDVYWEFPATKMPCPNQSCSDPEYRNSQTSLIGTLLDSAENTSVGTLMPEFEYRELAPREPVQ
jgi:hypothetical protein